MKPIILLITCIPKYKEYIMSKDSKMDMIDLIITVLIEHEKKLDVLLERLENQTNYIEDLIKREKIHDYRIDKRYKNSDLREILRARK